MAVKRVKKKEGEKLTPANIAKVISLLEQAPPITKKEACEILNIRYNTTRLNSIIEEYKAQLAYDEKRRAANRGKPASNQEVKDVIEWYLEGDSKSEIAERLYRSSTFVSNIVDTVGVPQRGNGQTYIKYEPLPEQCVSDRFEPEELVWAARYQSIAVVVKDRGLDSDGISTVYQIYVLEKIEEQSPYFAHKDWGGFYANQRAYELGSLRHLEKFGVDVRKAIGVSTRTASYSGGD